MKYVKILRDGKGVWGVLHGEVVRKQTCSLFLAITDL